MSREFQSPEDWERFLEMIALDGMRVPVACKRFGLTRRGLRRLLRDAPGLRAQYRRAVRYAKRRRFPEIVVEEMLEELARTSKSLKEIVLSRGLTPFQYTNLTNRLLNHSPEWRPQYLAARRAKVARLSTQLLDMPDDKLFMLGRQGIAKASFKVHSMRPMPERRAEAKQYRADRAAHDPNREAIDEARRRGRRRRPA